MPYGLHWEWRGFGRLDAAARRRVESLSPIGGVDTCTDRYVLLPDRHINLKFRTWPGGESLKIKRLIERDEDQAVELWLEDPAEDFALPLDAAATAGILELLRLPRSSGATVGTSREWTVLLGRLEPAVRRITVVKQRRAFAHVAEDLPVRVELTEITEPEVTTSVGIEDFGGLGKGSPPALIRRAADAVATVRKQLDLRLATLSYLDALAMWAGGGRLEIR